MSRLPALVMVCLLLSACMRPSLARAADEAPSPPAEAPEKPTDKPAQGQPKDQERGASDELPPITAEAFARGARLFRKKTCGNCHGIGEFFGKCPDLAGVIHRHRPAWLRRWIADPEAMRQSDEDARKLSEEYAEEIMPDLDLEAEEIESLLVYLRQEGIDPKTGKKR